MGCLRDDIIERLRLEIELSGPLLPRVALDAQAGRDSSTISDSQNAPAPLPKRSGSYDLTQQVTTDEPLKSSSQTKPASKSTSSKGKRKTKAREPDAATAEAMSKSANERMDPFDRIRDLIPTESPLHSFETLKEVEDYVANTVLIEVDRVRLNPVFGVGNPQADLMVIGEAPGAKEDEQGEPFVGRAGKLLTDILAAINFSRDDVYIANILKSRPPNNRNPTTDEIAAHVPILHKQITLIKPKILLCVGKVAANTLLSNTSSLAAMRESFQDYHGLPVVVTYHPAALLRNPNWKRPTWEDVQKLRKRFDELTGS